MARVLGNRRKALPDAGEHSEGGCWFTVFDTETTGLIGNRSMKLERQPEIIEFAVTVIDLDTGEICESWSTLIKPSQSIPKKNEEITGISNAMVSNALPFSAYSSLIWGLIGTSDVVVAHNARFDVDMVDIEFERLGIEVPWPETVCSIEATRHLIGGKSLNLGNLHNLLFGRKHEGAHRAAGDVEALVACLVELRARGEFPYGQGRRHS